MDKKARIVFIGASSFGLNCLRTIAALPEVEIVGVVTAPSSFTISYSPDKPVRNVLHADFQEFCRARVLPCYQLRENMREAALHECLKTWSPDILVVVGWYHLIPASLRALSARGAIGLHASALPKYRGGAPLVWAMLQGESSAGISLFRIEDGVDTGALIAQACVPILFRDTIATLYQRIEETGLQMLKANLLPFLQGIVKLRKQLPLAGAVKNWPQRKPEDGEINWNMHCLALYNFIRAQTRPYPGAFTYIGRNKLVVWRAVPFFFEYSCEAPGTILGTVEQPNAGLLVATINDDVPLLIQEVEYRGETITNMKRFITQMAGKKFQVFDRVRGNIIR